MNKNSTFSQKGKTGICTIHSHNSVQNYKCFENMDNRHYETMMSERRDTNEVEPTITIT